MLLDAAIRHTDFCAFYLRGILKSKPEASFCASPFTPFWRSGRRAGFIMDAKALSQTRLAMKRLSTAIEHYDYRVPVDELIKLSAESGPSELGQHLRSLPSPSCEFAGVRLGLCHCCSFGGPRTHTSYEPYVFQCRTLARCSCSTCTCTGRDVNLKRSRRPRKTRHVDSRCHRRIKTR